MRRRDWLDRALRVQGISQHRLAQAVGVHYNTPGRWVRGEQNIYSRHRATLAAALKLTLEELDAHETAYLMGLPRGAHEGGDTGGYPGDSIGLQTEAEARSGGMAVIPKGRLTEGAIGPLAAVVDDLRLLDDQAGGGAVLPLAEPHIEFITRFLTQGSYMPTVAEKLHRVLADALQLAGWASFDAGDHLRSARYYALSLNAAHSCGDPLMVTHTLAMMGFGARYMPDPDARHVLDAAGVSIPAGRRNDGVRAMVAAWKMHDRAARGDARGFERAFSGATRFFERSRREDWPRWMYWLWHPERMADVGHSLNRLGQHHRAIELLTEGERLATDWPRDRVLYLAFLAEAHRGLHDHEAAEHYRTKALDLMGDEIISGRLAALLALPPPRRAGRGATARDGPWLVP